MVHYLLMCLVNWQSIMEEVAHLILLMSICSNNIALNATMTTLMEHIIVVLIILIVRMSSCDRVTCVSLLEVSLLMSVTDCVRLDIILPCLLSLLLLEHACVIRLR